ncbi:MAG TPA: hypothetical protein VFL95_06820 [Gemmatimonadales bacterium]|nr:hypothetical protein [Gemmatimonadales bacterium]
MMRARRSILLLAAGVLLPASAAAQSAARPARIALVRDAADTARPAPPVATAAPVMVRGAPRSFQVVRVPVPAELANSHTVSFRIATNGIAPVLGARSGELQPNAGSRALLLTVAVPARARAGDLSVAAVRFRDENGREVEVPIMVSVAPIQQIEITIDETLRAVKAGDITAVRYRIINAGNAVDTVTVRAVTPPGWEVLEPLPGEQIELPIHGQLERQLRLRVPESAATGSEAVRLLAESQGRVVASAAISLQVLSRDGTATASDGPLLTVGAATVTGPWGATRAALSFNAQGPISDQIQLYARASTLGHNAGLSGYGFSLAGIYAAPPSLRLMSPHWQAGFGLTGASFSDLSGVNAAGTGVSGSVQRGKLRASVLAARPELGGVADSGSLFGAQVTAPVGPAEVTTTVTHLVEASEGGRQLDAVALGARSPEILDGVLSAELARRGYTGGSGFGWATSYERRTSRDAIRLRLTHAPGGSGAFARATNDLLLSGSRVLSQRVAVNGSLWRSRDDGRASLGRLATNGWALSSHFQASQTTTLGLDWRHSDFEADAAAGGFGTGESELTASLRLRRGIWYADGAASIGQTTRTITVPDGTPFAASAPRSGLRAALGMNGLRGTIEATARLDRSGQSVGQFPLQGEFGIRGERIPVARMAGAPVYISAGIDRYTWFGERAGATALSAGITTDLAMGLSLSLSAERNPFFIGANGRRGWIVAIKLEHATRLPRPINQTFHGMVYQDRNGNGLRDPGETGLAGLVVHRGPETAVTRKDGSYSFSGSSNSAPMLDARSLPAGMIASSSGPDAHGSIAVLGVATVTVEFSVAPEDSARVPAAELSRVIVMAHDSLGRTWVARADQPGRAMFDALPPGRYTVDLDLADLTEPLRMEGAAPTFVVGTGSVAPIRIELHARPIRFHTITPDSNTDTQP